MSSDLEYRTGEEWFDNPALVEDYTSNWYIRFPAGLRLSNNELPLWGRTVERDPFNNGLSGQCSNLIGVTPDATTSNNFEECNGPRFGLPFSDVPQVQYLGRGFDYVLSHNGPQCTETCPGDTDGDGIMNDNDDPQKDAPCPCYVSGYSCADERDSGRYPECQSGDAPFSGLSLLEHPDVPELYPNGIPCAPNELYRNIRYCSPWSATYGFFFGYYIR